MAFPAKRFQIRRVVCAMFGQFKDVMTMAILVWNRLKAVLTNAFIPLVHKLLELDPVVNLRATVPGEAYTGNVNYLKVCHALPKLSAPCRTGPPHALHCLVFSCHALATKRNPASPHPASPGQAQRNRTTHRQTRQYQTLHFSCHTLATKFTYAPQSG